MTTGERCARPRCGHWDGDAVHREPYGREIPVSGLSVVVLSHAYVPPGPSPAPEPPKTVEQAAGEMADDSMAKQCSECGLLWLDGRDCEHRIMPDEHALVVTPFDDPPTGPAYGEPAGEPPGGTQDRKCPSCGFVAHCRDCLQIAGHPLTCKLREPAGEPPDKNCYTLPDGSCVGKGCMHDAPGEPPEVAAPAPTYPALAVSVTLTRLIREHLRNCLRTIRGVDCPDLINIVHEWAQRIEQEPAGARGEDRLAEAREAAEQAFQASLKDDIAAEHLPSVPKALRAALAAYERVLQYPNDRTSADPCRE